MPTCANVCHSVPTWANIAVCQLCRERQPFWNSHDGLNLTCLDQCHGVRWLTPKNCYTVYSLNLIDQFTSLFSPKVIVAGLPRESFPHVFVDISVILWLCTRILPRLAQGVFSNEKELDRTTEAIVVVNERWRKLNANMHQYVPFRANLGQYCSLSAVQRKTGFLEQSWWPEFDMFGSMPWCSLADANKLL